MWRTSFLVLLVFFSFYGNAQETKVDSLKNLIAAEANKQIKLNHLESLNRILINKNANLEDSREYFNEMAALSNTLKNTKLETRAYLYLSESYIKGQDFKEAEKYAKKAMKIDSLSDNIKSSLNDLNQLGRVYHHFQKYNEAINTYKRAINLYEKNPQGKIIAIIYGNLGTSYEKLSNIEEAIPFYLKGIEYSEKFNNYDSKSYALYTLGNSYMYLEQYEKAEQYFLKAIQDSSKIKYKGYVNMNHHSLAQNYSDWGKYDKAIIHNKIALNYYHLKGNKLYEFDTLNNLAVVYLKKGDFDLALLNANKALVIANELNHRLAINAAKITLSNIYIKRNKYNKAKLLILDIAKDTIDIDLISRTSKLNIFNNLALSYEFENNYTKALKFYKSFNNLNDSIIKEKRDSNIAELETKYQTEKKEKENLVLKKEKAEQAELLAIESKRKWQLGGGLIVAMIALGIFTFYYRRNQKQKEVIENLQKELHHRIKNNLSVIDAFIDVIKDDFDDEAFTAKLTELQMRIDSINEVHLQLYNNKDVTNLNIKKYIDTLAENVSSSFTNSEVTINKAVSENLKLDADKTFPIGLIINEFLTNSYKYAFGESSGEITIEMKDLGEKYSLNLSDNGKGLPDEFDISKTDSFGLRLMNLLTKQLNGSLQITNNNGMQIAITFPK